MLNQASVMGNSLDYTSELDVNDAEGTGGG